MGKLVGGLKKDPSAKQLRNVLGATVKSISPELCVVAARSIEPMPCSMQWPCTVAVVQCAALRPPVVRCRAIRNALNRSPLRRRTPCAVPYGRSHQCAPLCPQPPAPNAMLLWSAAGRSMPPLPLPSRQARLLPTPRSRPKRCGTAAAIARRSGAPEAARIGSRQSSTSPSRRARLLPRRMCARRAIGRYGVRVCACVRVRVRVRVGVRACVCVSLSLYVRVCVYVRARACRVSMVACV